MLTRTTCQLQIFALLAILASQAAPAQTLEESLSAVGTTMFAPSAEMPLLDGPVISMANFRGKVVLVNFWATWCPPCVEELPTMQQAWSRFSSNDFEVLAIALDNDPAAVAKFVRNFSVPLEFPIVFDGQLTQYGLWGVKGVPTSYIVDRNGQIRYLAIGARNYASQPILKTLSGLIAE